MWATPRRSSPAASRAPRAARRIAGRRSGRASAAPRRASPARAPARRRSRRSAASVAQRQLQLLLVRPREVEVASCATSARTSEKPFAWRPVEASPTIASPARAADPSSSRSRSTTPTQKPGEVELVRLHEPRVLGGLAADERAAGLAAAGGDALDELRDLRRDRAARPRRSRGRTSGSAPLQTTSSAHIATRSRPIVSNRPERRRDRGLRADAVGRRRRAPARGSPAGSRPPRRTRRGRRGPPGRRVDSTAARISSTARSPASTSTPARGVAPAVALGHRHRHDASSSMNLRRAASYGTGSG